jgi:hypothetical protein
MTTTGNGEGRPLPRTASTPNASTNVEHIKVRENRRTRCIDCDYEKLARGYNRCRECLIALSDSLNRRHAADLRLDRWSA